MNKKILNDLITNGPTYHVWQAVWLSESLTRESNPDRKDYLLDQKGIRLRPHHNYEYPPRDIKSISYVKDEITFILTFLGLYGINSPLPRCYHEQIPIQEKILGEGNIPLQNFLDIFNNRFYWLYYQSWKKYRFYLHINSSNENKISERINAFIGKGIFSHTRTSRISDFSLLKYAGIISQRVRNSEGLRILLSHLFPELTIKIIENVPHWVELADIPALGTEDFILGENSYLGNSTIDYMNRICLEIGPISFEDYLNFLPGTLNEKKLSELLKLYLNDGLEYDIKFKVKADTITSVSWNDDRLKLGSSFWLGKPKQEDINVYLKNEEFTETASY
jgi:type VI secretion system protein ImpH